MSDSAWIGVVGAVVGGIASLGGTVLADYLNRKPERDLSNVRQKTLKQRFAASNRQWVPINALMDSIGADRETTIKYLLLIGARRSMAGNDSWGLKDWPEPTPRLGADK